jgi:hypothetical protein
MNPELPLWIGSAIGVEIIVLLPARQEWRRDQHLAE